MKNPSLSDSRLFRLFAVIAPFAAVSSLSADLALNASWTFEENFTSGTQATIGPISPEVGSGSFTGFHASAAMSWTTPAGNGSSRSQNSNNWAENDGYLFEFSTLGFTDVGVSWQQTGSDTGPRDWVAQVSSDGDIFSTVLSYSITNDSWSSVTANFRDQSVYSIPPQNVFLDDFPAQIYVRLLVASDVSISGGTIGSGGTSRIDNFTVSQIPEPSTYAMIIGGVLLAFAVARRPFLLPSPLGGGGRDSSTVWVRSGWPVFFDPGVTWAFDRGV